MAAPHAIVSTFFGDSPAPMFEDPPNAGSTARVTLSPLSSLKAWKLARTMASSTSRPFDEEYGKPFLVAGDIMSMFNDRPEVRALMEYFTTPQSAAGFLEQRWRPRRPPNRHP